MENQEEMDDGFQSLLDIISNRKGLILLCFLTVSMLSIIGAFFLPPVYETYTTILVQPEEIELQRDYVSPFSKDEFIGNQREIIKSRNILLEVINTLRLDKETKDPSFSQKIINIFFRTNPDPIEEAIRQLYKKVSIERTGAANVFRITVQAEDPFEAALIADTLAKIYSEYVNSTRLSKVRNNYDFIAEQVALAKQKLAESEEALLEFKEKEKFVSLKDETSNVLLNLSKAEDQYKEINSEIIKMEDQLSQARKCIEESTREESEFNTANMEAILSINLLNNNQKINEISTEMKSLMFELSLNVSRYSENYIKNNPQISILSEKLNETRTKLLRAVSEHLNHFEIQIDALKNKKINIENIIQKYNKALKKIPEKEFELSRLMRAIRTNEEIYLLFLKKLEGTRISEVTEKWNMGSVKVLDRAFPPPYPKRKKKAMLIMLGFMMGIVFGTGMAFFVEYKDRSIKTPREIEQLTTLPLLGVVPMTSRKHRKQFLGFKT